MFDLTIPATIGSMAGAWFTADHRTSRRRLGFTIWILSNVLFVTWAAMNQFWWVAGMYCWFQWTAVKGFRANRKATISDPLNLLTKEQV